MSPAARPRLAVAWASGCGGCEMALLDLGEELLDLERTFEIVSFPLLVDRPRRMLEELADDELDLAIVTGAVRTTEDVALVRLLRRVARRLVALGSCAQLGSVLALADLVPPAAMLTTVYGESGAAQLASGTEVGDEEALRPPALTPRVTPASTLVAVDHAIPGCPPERATLGAALACLSAVVTGRREEPPPGSVLGEGPVSVCEECPRQRPVDGVSTFARAHTRIPDGERCLLDQGLVCVGPATRGGCGAVCPAAGAGCRGCYGPSDACGDHGARAASALAAAIDAGAAGSDEAAVRQAIDGAVASLVDPVGTLYRFSFASSLLAGLGRDPGGQPCDD